MNRLFSRSSSTTAHLHCMEKFSSCGLPPDKTEEYAKALNAIGTSACRMIDNLLEFSRMQRDDGDLALSEFPLGEVIADCERLLRPELDAKSIEWSVVLEDTDLVVHADRDKGSQVFVVKQKNLYEHCLF